MTSTLWVAVIIAFAALPVFGRLQRRVQLSRAKHRSIGGHARISKRLARLLPHYEYDELAAFDCDGADAELAARRRDGFRRLAETLAVRSASNRALTSDVQGSVSDLQFTDAYRVPFQFRGLVQKALATGSFALESDDERIRDADGNWSYDLSGAYGVNLLGYDFYRNSIRRAVDKAEALGPVLGPYHPIVTENVRAIRSLSGMDEVSFHMSGTEAVMQAVRLARYHTGRSRLVLFCGAYHGWWDGVQPGVGNPLPPRDVFMLTEMAPATLKVLATRDDIACVLVNPLQALHPNASASGDSMLVASDRSAGFDKTAYADWLRQLREVCTQRNIVLIFDEVFMGFRLAPGGAQEFFGVRADMVTYGKTIGGGLPVGVLAGKQTLMKRFRDDRPTDICFARGTFNSHPYVMTAMNEFLEIATSAEFREESAAAEALWNRRAAAMNEALAQADLPIAVRNMLSVWTVVYTRPGRFNWMLQFYLRAAGLHLSWVGTGRFIFSHRLSDAAFADILQRFIEAARRMQKDGFFDAPPGLTNQSIKRQVLRELVSARWPGLRRRPPRRRARRDTSDQAIGPSSGRTAT